MKVREILEELANGTLSLDDEIEKDNYKVLFRHCDDWEHIVICENGINISDGVENHKLDAIDILEECEDLKQFEREQYYLNKLNPFDENGYNVVRRINKDLICLNTIKLKCSRCKKEFESTSKLRKYCDACSKIIKEASRDEWIKCGCGMRYLSASKETEGMWEAIGSPESEEAFYDWC